MSHVSLRTLVFTVVCIVDFSNETECAVRKGKTSGDPNKNSCCDTRGITTKVGERPVKKKKKRKENGGDVLPLYE